MRLFPLPYLNPLKKKKIDEYNIIATPVLVAAVTMD